MGFDSLLKRYFAILVLALIAAAAYFQASGVSNFVGARLIVDSEDLAAPPPTQAGLPVSKPAYAATSERVSGEPILKRNPFDSVTGPLTGIDAGVGEGGAPEEEVVDFSRPYAAPACDDAEVLIITAAEDPLWSMAALSDVRKGDTVLRRIGDTVGNKRIWYIAWDRVWLQGDGEFCQAKMFAEKKAKPKKKAWLKPKPKPRPMRRRGPPQVPKDIADRIQKVSDTEFNVDRSVVDRILENQSELMRSARIVPEKKDGKVVGIRLLRVRPDTLLGTLGLQNGDRVEKINGFDITSPEKALEAYARLRTAGNLSVSITRRGKPMTIDFNIR
ncbi:MAG: type II secretion system protein GspC [Myxococcota bacterium]